MIDAVEIYIRELDRSLKVDRRTKERILTETEDHLRERAEREAARGKAGFVAELIAIDAFGPADEFADRFCVEHATMTVRRFFAPMFLLTCVGAVASVGVMVAALVPLIMLAHRLRGAASPGVEGLQGYAGLFGCIVVLAFGFGLTIQSIDTTWWQSAAGYASAISALLLAVPTWNLWRRISELKAAEIRLADGVYG